MHTSTTAADLLTASRSGHVAMVTPHGPLGVDDCSALRAALRTAIDGVTLLVVDLLDVPEIDDAVVEVLVGAAGRCAAGDLGFVVANAAAQPWRALTAARVAGVLRLHRRTAPPLSELLDLLEH
jgi:anti-anti-sigma regulatory factor